MENIINKPIEIDATFTKEELEALAIAREKQIVFDDDCPETTPERALKFKRVNAHKAAVAE